MNGVGMEDCSREPEKAAKLNCKQDNSLYCIGRARAILLFGNAAWQRDNRCSRSRITGKDRTDLSPSIAAINRASAGRERSRKVQ
jgi:hypothetical protein